MVEPVDVLNRRAYLTWSRCLHRASARMSSVLCKPMANSAKVLRYESPTDPTDGFGVGFAERARVAGRLVPVVGIGVMHEAAGGSVGPRS